MHEVIRQLPENVSNQIAAGEVVQRPASAVKELMENAIDAGASRIEVRVVDAGRTLIQVLDNGAGMVSADAARCFQRHATSKISVAEDLYSIVSKGFRGEALASIASATTPRWDFEVAYDNSLPWYLGYDNESRFSRLRRSFPARFT